MVPSRISALLLSAFCAACLLSGNIKAGQNAQNGQTAKPNLFVAVYGVTDLVIPADAPATGDKTTEKALLSIIRHNVDPASWEERGGEANANYFPLGQALVVRQTPANHEKMVELLKELRTDMADCKCKQDCEAEYREILKRVKEAITTSVGSINDQKMQMVTYPVADLVIPTEEMKLAQSKLLNSRWQMAITEPVRLADAYQQKVYPQPVPLQMITQASGVTEPGKTDAQSCQPPRPAAVQTMEELLIRLITNTIEPSSWSDVGGKGTIQFFPLGHALVVSQTRDIQEQIVDLLTALRRLQEVEVAVETRIVTLSRPMGEHFLTVNKFEEKQSCDPRTSGKVAFLDDRLVRHWMEFFQGDKNANVMQAPKITMFNGQAVNINVGDEVPFLESVKVGYSNGQAVLQPQQKLVQIGFFAKVLPVVSADRKFVRLHLDVNHTSLEPNATPTEVETNVQKLTLDRVVMLPDNGTAVFHLGKTMEVVRGDAKMPLLYRVPYLNRLFRNVGYGQEERDVFLLVTTHVIVNEQVEPEFRGNLERIPR